MLLPLGGLLFWTPPLGAVPVWLRLCALTLLWPTFGEHSRIRTQSTLDTTSSHTLWLD